MVHEYDGAPMPGPQPLQGEYEQSERSSVRDQSAVGGDRGRQDRPEYASDRQEHGNPEVVIRPIQRNEYGDCPYPNGEQQYDQRPGHLNTSHLAVSIPH
jgi:hypothetical protein